MGAEETMAAPDRRKRKKKVVVKTLVRVFFVLLLLSMLAAYISNQVSISSKRAELDTLNEQIDSRKPRMRKCSASSAAIRIRSQNGSRGILTTTPHRTSASLWM